MGIILPSTSLGVPVPRTFKSFDGAQVEETRASRSKLSLAKPEEAQRRWVVDIHLDKNWDATGFRDPLASRYFTSADTWSNVKARGDKLPSAKRHRDPAQNKGWPLVTALVSLSLAVALSAWMLPDLADPPPMKNSASPNSLRQGRLVYGQVCAGCHGVDLKGAANENSNQSALSVLEPPSSPPPPLDESGHSWMHTDGELFRIVKYGIANCGTTDTGSVMPGFGDEIDDGALEEVIAFVKSQWPDKIQRFQNVLNEGGAATRPSQGEMICSRHCLSMQYAPTAPATVENRAR